jgi:outer membrane immunogenic protein
MRFAIASVSVVLAAGHALAADLIRPPVVAPVVVTPQRTSWTACYIGLNGGGARAHKDTLWTRQGRAVGPNGEGVALDSMDFNSWAFGGQIGCDHQVHNNWTVGVRGMLDTTNLKASHAFQATDPGDTQTYDIHWFGTVVGKVGYLVHPNFELYGLAGVAWARETLTWTATDTGVDFATGSDTRTGYDVGIGASWLLAPHWNVFVEYDHMAFAKKAFPLHGVGQFAGIDWGADVKQSVDKILVGLNFRL